jgi:hypothetical protein
LRNNERIELSPDGRLVLLAAPRTHQQVQREILEPLASRPRTSPKPAGLSITYWMVLARLGRAAARAATPAGMAEIAPALAEIKKASGTAELVLLERLRLSSMEGPAKSTGRSFAVKQHASTSGGMVVSDVTVEGVFQGQGLLAHMGVRQEEIISTRISVKPGQIVVLGELGMRGLLVGLPKEVPPPEASDTLFIILQASVTDAVASK